MNYLTEEHRLELYKLFENIYETNQEAEAVLRSFIEKHPEYEVCHIKSYQEKPTACIYVIDDDPGFIHVYYETGHQTPVKTTYEYDNQYQKLVRSCDNDHIKAEKQIAQELRDMADGLEHHTGPYKNSFVVYNYESKWDGFCKTIKLAVGGYIGG